MGCAICDFKNFHKGHKLISIEDNESLRKENFDLDSSMNECNEYTKKIKNLEKKIENEIEEINNVYEKIYKEINKAYEEKHAKLILEENNLKENLKNEVTKTKEKLENDLTYSKEIIRANERIIKGLNIFKNEEEKSIIRILSYVSKMSEIQKEAKLLLGKMIKTIKINFNNEKCNIKFEDYIFNGIHIPKNIEFKDIKSNSVEILWKIDDIKIENIDINKYLFRVELRKENSKKKFTKVYEGSNYNCIIKNLNMNVNYEIRICSFNNNINSSWSNIKIFKTDNINESLILNDEDKHKLFTWLNPLFNGKSFYLKLLYKRGNDMSYETFHKKCDNKGQTVIICKSKIEKFGGYTNINWESLEGKPIYQKGPFIFSINKNKKFEYCNNNNNSIHLCKKYGPDFFWDFVFNTDKQMKVCICAPKTYGYAYSSEALIGDGTYKEIEVDEIEAFEIKVIN